MAMLSAVLAQRCLALVTLAVLVAVAPSSAAEAIRVLVLSGMNNHDWVNTTPAIVQALEADARFSVDVTEDPAALTGDALAPYDVVVSNWTNYPSEERIWGPAAEDALLWFVERGGGLVAVHAAIACFPTWWTYRETVGAAWEADVTGHGAYHPFGVTITDADHPVTRGLGDFVITDELWHRVDLSPGAHVIARAYSAPESGGTGRAEPVALVTTRGRGRCFTLVLGHDVAAMDSAEWQTLLRNGTEWAATGDVAAAAAPNPDEALDAVLDYTPGSDRTPVRTVERLVQDAVSGARTKRLLAAKVAHAAERTRTADAEAFLVEQLGLIGGDAEVAVLASRLADNVVGHRALEALRRIGSPAAASALREALATTDGALRGGVAEALGDMGDEQSVASLTQLAAGEDDLCAEAAIRALGDIGSMSAAERLRPLLRQPERATLAAEALLECAGRQERIANLAGASTLYGIVMGARGCPMRSEERRAAVAGRMRTTPGERLGLVLAGLSSPDTREVAASAGCVGLLTARERETVARHIEALAPVPRVRVLAVLADAGDAQAMPALRALYRGCDDADAKRAAWEYLSRVGDESAVTRSAPLPDPGPNLALGATATSPDGIDKDGDASGDEAAIDGNPATYWDEADGQPEYRLRVAFDGPREVGALRITGHVHHNYAPRDFEILCDGVVIGSVRGAWYEANQFTVAFAAVRCSVVELRITGYYGQSPAIRELELFGAREGQPGKGGGAA